MSLFFYKAKTQNKNNEKIISDETYNLILFFIQSNTTLAQLKSKFLKNIIKSEVEVFSVYTFRNTILPAIMDNMHNEIESKLKNTASITLIADGWTGQFSNMEYLAIAARTTNNSFDSELFVIGMVPMPTGHDADEIKKAIDLILSKYKIKFDKIYAFVSDEGTNMTYLFEDFDDYELLLKFSEETSDDDEDETEG